MNLSSVIKNIRRKISYKADDRAELMEILNDASQRGIFDTDAMSMIEGAMLVSDLHARDTMIPRSQMIVIDQFAQAEDILNIAVESGHSRSWKS